MTFVIETDGLDAVRARIQRMGSPDFTGDILRDVAAAVELQTVERIDRTKTSPTGTPWAPRSPQYAADAPGTLMEASGSLLASIQRTVTESEASVGSPLAYARVHQLGTERLAPRPFLGLSEENEAKVLALVEAAFLRAVA